MKYLLLLVAIFAAIILFAPPRPSTAPNDAGVEAIEHVATLETPRAVHTATVLPSGHVLVAGGMNAEGTSLASTEIVDLSAGQVSAGPALSEARTGHTATPLPDGRVLIAGGYNGSYLTSVEIYDPSAERFDPAGHLLEGRSGHTATLLPDGRILFAGGVGQGWTFLSSAELFDLSAGSSEAVDTMSVARESHTATLLEDGRVLVIGGHSGRRPALIVYATAELFDPALRRFAPAGRLETPRHKHDAVLLADGRVLVVGGADRTDRTYFATTEVYSLDGNAFTPGPTMRHTRYKIAGTVLLLPDSSVLIPTGARRAELLDAPSKGFREIPGEFPDAYHFATATLLPSGEVAIIGGYGEDNHTTAGIWRFRGVPEPQ